MESRDDIKSIDVKCYKSVSCIIGILVILFIFGAVTYDLVWAKPELRTNIKDMHTELSTIKDHVERIDSQQTKTYSEFKKYVNHEK